MCIRDRPGIEAGDGRERRLEARLPATTLEGVQQRGLLTADVRAGAGVHGDVQVEAAAEDVLAQIACGVSLFDRSQQAAVDVDDLAAHIDEGMVAADGERRDDHALDQELWGRHHQRDVLAGARLGLVGVDHEVAGTAVRGWQETPLHAGGEARAATTTQTGVLGQLHQIGLWHLQGVLQGFVAVVLLVGRQRPGLGVVPELGEDRGQLRAHFFFAFPCWALATLRPSSDAGPAPTPSSARPSWKPARTRETSLKLQTLDAPRVGVTDAPERRSSTSWLVDWGVWLSKNSQLAMTTGA